MGQRAMLRVGGVLLALMSWAAARGQTVTVAGSSTLYPASVMFAAEVEERLPAADLEATFAGTAAGFDLLCKGAAPIIGASRLATPEEQEACAANGVEYLAFPVAVDAVMLVVSSENDWVRCLTLAEVRRLWSGGPMSIDSWSELRPLWPDREIEFYAPGVASGTYQYWHEQVVGPETGMRTDYFPSEDDRLLAQRTASDRDAISFFGRAQLKLAGDRLRAVAIDDGFGCVDPANLARGVPGRWPFIRPLFLFVDAAAAAPDAESRAAIAAFVESFLSPGGQARLRSAGYLPLEEQVRLEATSRFRQRIAGPLAADYGGQSILRQLPGGWTRRQGNLRDRLLVLERQVQTVGVVHGSFDTLFQSLLDSRSGGIHNP